MADTSLSLLDRLSADPASDSWRQFSDLYTPLLEQWLRRYGVQGADADDLAQDVLMVVMREVPEFRHNRRQGAFRKWLRTILVNRIRDYSRSRKNRPIAPGGSDFTKQLEELQDDGSGLSRAFEQEHDRHVVRRLLERIEPMFSATTWQAFRRVTIDAEPAEAVAAELGMTTNAVYIAKSRILATLRQESAGLVD